MDITRWSTDIRLITFFAAKDGEALYSQQKQDRELTVAQIMNPLCLFRLLIYFYYFLVVLVVISLFPLFL